MLVYADLNRFHNFGIVHHYVCPGSKYSKKSRKMKTKDEKQQMGGSQDIPVISPEPVSLRSNSTMSKLSFGFVIRPCLILCVMLLCLSKLPHMFSSKVYHQHIGSSLPNGSSNLVVLNNSLSFSLPSPKGMGVAKSFSTMIQHIIEGTRPFYMTNTNG